MIKITMDNFETEVMQSEKPVLLDFWATWCGPCSSFSPILDEYESSNADKIVLGKVNVDEEKDLAKKFRVMGIPTIVLMKNGTKAASSTGVLTLNELQKFVEQNL